MTTPEFLDLLSETAHLDSDGEVVMGGCRLSALAASYGTPLFVVDEMSLRHQGQRFHRGLQERWPKSRAVFASKAFPCTAIYELMAQEGLGVDVAGGGELVLALNGGVDPALMVMHGNAKTDVELSMAIDAGVGTIVIDNFDDIDRLEKLVTADQGVLVRVVPGVRGVTHDAMSTGQEGSKFGLSHDDAVNAIRRLQQSDHLRLDGLHMHIGSQILETEPFAHAVEVLANYGDFDVYDLGGGLGVRYTYSDVAPTPEAWLDALVTAAKRSLPRHAELLIEPGRAMVAQSMVTLYRVTTVKHGVPTFVAVDGGMADNLDVSLYGQRYEATIVNKVGGGASVDLVGRHCESGDCLIHGVELNDPSIGDIVAVGVTGAYAFTMLNNYNGALKPAVVFVADGKADLRVRRENYGDFFLRDVASGAEGTNYG
jgi:diaminopimelate decarboxylase